MVVTDARKDLINEILQYMLPFTPDLTDAESTLYILLNKYEITSRCTEIAEVQGDRNIYLLKKFLIAKTVKGCTPRTLEYYKESITRALANIGKTVDDITADDIRYYMAVRQQRDRVSKTTIANEHRNLSSFFGWIYKEELIKSNPMSKIELIKQDKTKKEALTEMEIEQLRAAAKNEKEKAIIEIFLSTGCRVSELVNIKLSEIEGNRVLVHGKGGKDRYVYLNARAELAVNIYTNTRSDKNPWLFPKGVSCGDIEKKGKGKKSIEEWWKNPKNIAEGHMDKSSIGGTCRKIAKRAGVGRANPHKFRRTCATLALRRGMPIEQVSKMLGHEQISTTQIYLDLTEGELVQAHKRYVV